MFRIVRIAAVAALAALASTADAQQGRGRPPEIPAAYRPPAGMCRIWIEGVAPAQQPAVTDCPTAVRNKPQNGWVIFGDDYRPGRGSKLPPPKRLRGDAAERAARDTSPERLLALGGARDRFDRPYDRSDDADDDEYDTPDQRPGAGRESCIDRDRDGRCDDMSRDSDGCVDANGDGRCDDARYDAACGRRDRYGRPFDRRCDYDDRNGAARGVANGDGICLDRNRDGRCDEPWSERYDTPQTLPDMYSAVLLTRGQASYDVERWIRSTSLQPRITDANGDGDPEKVTWLDERGRVVQVWTELNGDGIADRIEFFEGGRRVRTIGR